MTLSQTQREFTRCVGQLIARIYASGYEATFGEAWRTDEQAVINSIGESGRLELAAHLASKFPALAVAVSNNGKANGILLSVHRERLAVDLNLFKDGVFLEADTDHRPFGEFWESLHELARWGGRFGDANHYSFEWGGRK